MPLKGQNVYITGGTGGIGAPLVLLLKEAGANVLLYDNKQTGGLVETLDETSAFLKENTPDILINMAGYNVFDYCENQDLNDILNLNLLVPVTLSQAVLPAMKARHSGQIVNIGSMSALIPLPHMSGYVAAKAGLKGFSDSVRRELGESGVAITYIAPRAVRTSMNAGVQGKFNEQNGTYYDEPSFVAQRIFKAIVRREREVRFGLPERFFAFLNANFPQIIDSGLKKSTKIGERVLSGSRDKEQSSVEQKAA